MPFHELSRDRLLKVVVTKVYDGDTVYGVIEDGDHVGKYRIRMTGYDSPEMKPPKNLANRDAVIVKAKEAKKVMERLVLSTEKTDKRILRLQFDGWDKYGRVLGTIYLSEMNESVNHYMITNGYGYEYDGGTKKPPSM